ncbi:irregular chiasm C-roughest protein-like isoform X2 [Portunus trituberculatus]|uniref:irregular chiasm C-roughest protein-like isoform X2 n=1 Tax=Portunus trituberculatus TaxID=210409 RepID=UPI001E1CE373|nr:irregular chiasm C-roughest protein-like isoform X2 [Portunus trituberculatus]XP_045108724.1 irregular chiasm C-roughest protein-like isoform X2 [Portunus trituberculatus]
MDTSPQQTIILSNMDTFSLIAVEVNRKLARTRWKRPSLTTVLLVYLTVTSALVTIAYGEQRFVQQPENVTVKHGESVTLPCKIADRKGAVQWTKDGFGLGTDKDLLGFSRYRMNVDETAGVYNLHIQPVLVEDDARYQCQVGGAEGERHLKSATATLTVHFPPTDSPDQVYLDTSSPMETTSGSPVRITCEAGLSAPASEIEWYMNGKEGVSGGKVNTTKTPQHNSILVAVKSRLDLTPEKKHHQANISCEVRHKALETPIVRSVVMSVKYPPDPTITVDSAKIQEKDDVMFKCEAEANPPTLRYRWEVNGVAVVGDHTAHYLMTHVDRSSNGAKVACIAANDIGTNKAEHTLSVQYAPRFKTEPEDHDADNGKNLTLTCNVDGNPPPEIVWLHEEGKKVINLGSRMTFTVTPETVGTYHCRAAVTGFPEESRSMRVYMRGAPVVVEAAEQFGMEGDDVKVECMVEGMPRPDRVEWAKGRRPLNTNTSRYTALTEAVSGGLKATLVVRDAEEADFGEYNCTARNTYGSHTGVIFLKRQQSLPLVTTLVAIIGGIVFLVVVVVVIVLFKKKGRTYKDPGLEKNSMRSSDLSSTHDSVLKVETRTATGSDLSPSEEEDYSSHDDWESGDGCGVRRPPLPRDPLCYSAVDYTDTVFPLKDHPNNNTSGGYIKYYSRDYDPPPPPPLSFNRNSIYTTNQGGGAALNNVDPRYSAAYGNPYLRVPSRTGTQGIYGSSGGLDTGTVTGGMSQPPQPSLFVTAASQPHIMNNNNNNNTLNNTSAIYGQNRNNLRLSANLNNQYITMPQGDGRNSVHGTHI